VSDLLLGLDQQFANPAGIFQASAQGVLDLIVPSIDSGGQFRQGTHGPDDVVLFTQDVFLSCKGPDGPLACSEAVLGQARGRSRPAGSYSALASFFAAE
jgi:hypothetical protein